MDNQATIYPEDCYTRRLLEIIGDKWKPVVLTILSNGIRRYGQVQKCMPDVSKKMLTQTLRSLEGDGLLNRTVYAAVPPKVDYELTSLGQTFVEPVAILCRWASDHTDELDQVEVSRKKSLQEK